MRKSHQLLGSSPACFVTDLLVFAVAFLLLFRMSMGGFCVRRGPDIFGSSAEVGPEAGDPGLDALVRRAITGS